MTYLFKHNKLVILFVFAFSFFVLNFFVYNKADAYDVNCNPNTQQDAIVSNPGGSTYQSDNCYIPASSGYFDTARADWVCSYPCGNGQGHTVLCVLSPGGTAGGTRCAMESYYHPANSGAGGSLATSCGVAGGCDAFEVSVTALMSTLYADASANFVPTPIYVTPPYATPVPPVNLNFNVKNACTNNPVSGASVVINQDFGNGTNRNTDGSGFANFGVNPNTNIGWTVSAGGFNNSSNSVNSGANGTTVNVNLNCIAPPQYPPGAFSFGGNCSVVSASNNRANLSWGASANATSYRVEKRPWSNGSWQTAGTTSATSFSEVVGNSIDYYYRVYAINGVGTQLSNEAEILICQASGAGYGYQTPIIYSYQYQTPTGGCSDNSSVSFTNPIPGSVTPGQSVNFTVRVTDTGNTRWYHGDGYRFIQQSGFALEQSYGHLPYGVWPGDYVDWSFTLTAPSTPGNYTLNMQMMHYGGWQYIKDNGSTCGAPGSNTYFGQTASANFTVGTTYAYQTPVYNYQYQTPPYSYQYQYPTPPALCTPANDNGTGGAITDISVSGVPWRVHTFTSPGAFVAPTSGNTNIEYLIVGGGGSAGLWGNGGSVGGGGGGGGVVIGTSTVASGVSYGVTVGVGGPPGDYNVPGNNGGNSSIAGLGLTTAVGGGGGGANNAGNGKNGGSGGGGYGHPGAGWAGSGGSGTSGQGFSGSDGCNGDPGPRAAGGGGGAGGPGTACSGGVGGSGGPGITSTISGSSKVYSTGSAGDGEVSSGNTPSSVYGGGGMGNDYGISGSPGVVIIRYQRTTATMCGTLTPGAVCSIALDQNSCNMNLNWSITTPEATPTTIQATGMSNITVTNTLTTPQSGVQSVTVPYNTRTFSLNNNSKKIVETTVNVNCVAETAWNGSECVSGNVKANLTADPAFPFTATVGVGENFSAKILNTGGVGTGISFPYFFQVASVPPTPPPPEGTIYDRASNTMSSLNAGAFANASDSISFTSPGNKSARVCADKTSSAGGGVIDESDEGDNCGAWVGVTASCPSGTSWNGSACVTSPVNGVCSPAHYLCTTGTSANNVDGADSWTWNCNGSNGGTNASCSESKSITLTADPEVIFAGESTTLDWSAPGTSSCSSSQFETGGATSGSVVVKPLSTTTYTVTCDGTKVASRTVTVKKRPFFIEN